MSEIGESRRYEPDPEYSYSSEEFLRRVRGNPYPAAKTQARRPAPSSNFSRPAFKRGANADPLLGQKVRHAEYGVGTVVGVEGDEEDRRLSVSFPGRGTKKFVERYANLQQV
jgi:DNA helicase II / ATP-dependent DNA helicase PcrA